MQTKCPTCRSVFRVEPSALGKQAKCRACGDAFTISIAADETGGTPPPARPVGVSPVRPTPVAPSPMGSLPVGSLPVASLPSGQLPMGSLPVASLPSGQLPMGSLPVASLPSGPKPAGPLPVASVPSGSGAFAQPTGAGTGGKRIGRFLVRTELGAGAFGAVYRAFDEVLKREVALKVPHPSALQSKGVAERFVREAESAAQLHHPNIVPIHDVGVAAGQAYIAAAFIDGQTLQSSLRQGPVAPHDAARLIRKLAEALHYAHTKGVVHRDVKPANVMVDRLGEPHLADFGMARWDHADEQLTQDGMLMGTPAYMSPEQAAMRNAEVGPASDQYALGVMLYEMLAGRRPFDGAPVAILLHHIRETIPEPPGTHVPGLPADLSVICMKILSKSPADRYADCAALSADLARFLSGDPIRARRLSPVERTVRWCRKNPTIAALTASVAGLLLLTAVVSSLSAARQTLLLRAAEAARDKEAAAVVVAEEQRKLAEDQKRAAEEQKRAAEEQKRAAEAARDKEAAALATAEEQRKLAEAQRKQAETSKQEAEAARDKVAEALATAEAQRLAAEEQKKLAGTNAELADRRRKDGLRNLYATQMNLAQTSWNSGNFPNISRILESTVPAAGEEDLRGFEWHYWSRRCRADLLTLRGPTWITCLAYSPNGRFLAAGGAEETVKIWDAASGKEWKVLPGHARGVVSLDFSPNGRLLATADREMEVRIWNPETGEMVSKFDVPRTGDDPRESSIAQIDFGPDGRRMSIAIDNAGRDPKKGPLVAIGIWDIKTRHKLQENQHFASTVRSVNFSPDGSQLAFAGYAGSQSGVVFWNSASLKERLRIADFESTQDTTSIDFSPDGQRLATSSRGGGMRIWNVADGKSIAVGKTGNGEKHDLLSIDFAPDGRRTATGGEDCTVRLWDAATGQETAVLFGHTAKVRRVAFSPDGKRLASAGEDHCVKVWRNSADKESSIDADGREDHGPIAFAPDSRQMCAVCTGDLGSRIIGMWDVESRREIWRFPNAMFTGDPELSFDAAGKRIVCYGKTVLPGVPPVILPGVPPTVIGSNRSPGIVRHGKYFCNVRRIVKPPEIAPEGIQMWDVRTKKLLRTIPGHVLAYDPSHAVAAMASKEKETIDLVQLETGNVVSKRVGSVGTACCFSPDGKRLAVAEFGITLWNLGAGPAVKSVSVGDDLIFNRPNTRRRSLAFSPDGKRLLGAGEGKTAVFDLETTKEIAEFRGHVGLVRSVAFSPDGLRAATAGEDKTIRIWDAWTGQELLLFSEPGASFHTMAFSPDGHLLAVRSVEGTIKFLDARPFDFRGIRGTATEAP